MVSPDTRYPIRRSGEAGGVILKRDRKRPIRDYSKFNETDKEYYGLFYKKEKLRIDVKRLAKKEIISPEIITHINNMPRNTAYFFPKKKKKLEYSCNIFRNEIDALTAIWGEEIIPITCKIKTSEDVMNESYPKYMSDGIMEHEEASSASIMNGIRRSPRYHSVIGMIYGQYLHLIGSVVEYSIIKVMEENGHSLKRFNIKTLRRLLKNKYKINLDEIPSVREYKKFNALWNFLKHNSISSYNNVKKQYPEVLIKEPFESGMFALWHVNPNMAPITGILDGLKDFFDSFCETVFGEDLYEASWNYDDYFLEEYKK